jgi:hypothetical protein
MDHSTYDDDPFLKDLIDDALLPYVSVLTPDELRFLREELADAARFHPVAARLLKAARPDPKVERSGDVAVEGEQTAPDRARRAR